MKNFFKKNPNVLMLVGNALVYCGLFILCISALMMFVEHESIRATEISSNAVLESIESQINTNSDMSESDIGKDVTDSDGLESEPAQDSATGAQNNDLNPNVNSVSQKPISIEDLGKEDYWGIVSIDSIGIQVPVLNICTEQTLKIAPGVHLEYEDGSAVIAGHNYKYHFGKFSSVSLGDRVSVTKIDGSLYNLKVSEKYFVSADDTSILEQDNWDLVMYTCDVTNQNRIVLCCVLENSDK